MRALDRKMLRDLLAMRGQVVAIAVVIASGIGAYVASVSTLASLRESQATFYREHGFGDLFASVTRAPSNVAQRVSILPGVAVVESRIVEGANLTVPGFDAPVSAQLASLPDDDLPALDTPYFVEGGPPETTDQVAVNDAFAEAHDLHPGDSLTAVLNGRRRTLMISGAAISPENIYLVNPNSVFPDAERFGLLWMREDALEAAYDMEGAFNSLAVSLTPGADANDVLDRLDALLDRYGGRGAFDREDQPSHRYLTEEFKGLETMATILPGIFLAVAAFLLNIVVSRLIRTQREQIATLKAFGYGNVAVGWHYVKLVLVVVVLGAVAGILLGVWMGNSMSNLYLEFYRFPELVYRLPPQAAILSIGISAAAAIAGTLYSIQQAVRLPPAVAMRPEPPANYRPTIVERLGFAHWFSQPTRMILRRLERQPLKAALSMIGIALACAILVVGRFFSDAIDYMVHAQFEVAGQEDFTVTFTDARSYDAIFELEALPGVYYAEPFRSVAVELRNGAHAYRTAIQGVAPERHLHRIMNRELRPVDIPPGGLVLTDYLADLLDVSAGDYLMVEVLEGRKVERMMPVLGTTSELVGVSAYAQLSTLNRLVREGPAISGAYLAADQALRPRIYDELQRRPFVASIVSQDEIVESFFETSGGTLLAFTLILTAFAAVIAFGVVYNTSRISLAERDRELASLRVLGFTRGEVSYILLGEIAVLTFVAIPAGLLMGWVLSIGAAEGMATDLFRIPIYITRETYAGAALVILVTTVVSALIIRRRLNRLDLIGVLKTRE